MTACRQVLVLDADQLSTLAVVRSLGRHGCAVTAAAASPHAIAFQSRYASQRLIYPDPLQQHRAFLEWLTNTLTNHSFDLMIPVTDRSIVPILTIRNALEALSPIAIAPNPVMEQVVSKCRMHSLARKAGLDVPESWIIKAPAALDTIDPRNGFPLVVKAERSLAWLDGYGQALETRYVADRATLKDIGARYALYGDVLVQSRVMGHGVGLGLLARDGLLLNCFQYRRLHELPLTGGGSAYRVSEILDPVLEGQATQLVRQLGWHGAMMLEFKYDPRAKMYWFIEANGRFWGGLPLALAAGVDFPKHLVALYQNQPVSQSAYSAGVRGRNLERDIDWTRSAVRHADIPMTRIVSDALKLVLPREHIDSFTIDDPRPLVSEVQRIGCRLISAARRRKRLFASNARENVLRKNPQQIRSCLQQARRLVLVCSGNVMRSAFAEAYLAKLFSSQHGGPAIISAGLDAQPGRPADPIARSIAQDYKLSLEGHRALGLATLELTENDVIFVMERTQVAEATRRYPAHASRIYLLTALNPSLPIDIVDPNGEGPATCQAIFHQIIDALEPVIDCITHQRERLP